MRLKKIFALMTAAVLAASMLTGCPWDEQDKDGGVSQDDSSSSASSGGGHTDGAGGSHDDDGDDDTPQSCTVTANITENGTVAYNGQNITNGASFSGVPAGTTASFTVTPGDGYAAEVTATGGSLASGGNHTYTLTVTGNCTVTVSFVKIEAATLGSIGEKSFAEVLKDELSKDTEGLDLTVTCYESPVGDRPPESVYYEALFSAIEAGGDVDDMAQAAAAVSSELNPTNAGDEAFRDFKEGEKGMWYLCIYKYENAVGLKNRITRDFSDLNAEFGYVFNITVASAGETNYAMILVQKQQDAGVGNE